LFFTPQLLINQGGNLLRNFTLGGAVSTRPEEIMSFTRSIHIVFFKLNPEGMTGL